MTDELRDTIEEADQAVHANGELNDGEMVHWMARPPLRVGVGGLSAAALGGFACGVAATLGVLALAGWIGPDRAPPRRRA